MVALGQPNDARNPLLGDVPTLKEQGLDLTMDKPYVVAFPKGTDPAIVAKMADLMKQITEIPEYAEDLKKFTGRMASTALDPSRPLWQFQLVDNYNGGHALVARMPPQRLPEPGQALRVTVEGAALHFFDPDSGLRL